MGFPRSTGQSSPAEIIDNPTANIKYDAGKIALPLNTPDVRVDLQTLHTFALGAGECGRGHQSPAVSLRLPLSGTTSPPAAPPVAT